jgi:cytochrome c-type biogenesis protein CcmH/NrfG
MANGSQEEAGVTWAATCGLTRELGRAIAEVAAAELAAGRIESAREISEGLAVSNPYDAAPWIVLALVHRRRGNLAAARLCAEVAKRTAPDDEQVRLARAEILLAARDGRSGGKEELAALAVGESEVAGRARALLAAMTCEAPGARTGAPSAPHRA